MDDPLAAFRAVVGEPHARPAAAADAVDGVAARHVVEPGTIEETAAALRLASASGLAVVPRGGGSKLAWGAPPRRADVVLSTARLDQVLEHAAGDLVVRAQAGVRIETLQRRLATSSQWLALDPPEAGATLGGIVASGACGPRRHRYGTARDLLIGVTVALADGTLARAGGKVVKNVAGYDLAKLFAGSFGTLGVLVETTFRLHPRPEAQRLVLVELETPTAAAAAVGALEGSPLEPSAVELGWSSRPQAAGRLAVLFESVLEAAEAQATRAMALLAPFGQTRLVDEAGFTAEWRVVSGTGAAAPGDAAELKITGLPARLAETLEAALAASREQYLALSLRGRAGLGVWLATLEGEPAAIVAGVESLRLRLSEDARVVVRSAPLAVKQRVDAWGDAGDALPLMRRVKERFDPDATLAPGRFVGGL